MEFLFIATKTKLSEATTTIKTSEMDLKHYTKTLQDKERTQVQSDSSDQKNKQNLENKEREIKVLQVIKALLASGIKIFLMEFRVVHCL